MKKKKDNRTFTAFLSILIVILIIQTFLVWFLPHADPSRGKSTGLVTLKVSSPSPEPAVGLVSVSVVGGGT